MSLDVGQVYHAAFAVTDVSGAPVVPSAVTLKITRPVFDTTTGQLQTLSPAVTPAAVSSYDYTLADPGLHIFDWASTGPGTAQTNYVTARRFVSILSLEESKDFLGVTGTSKDQKIRLLMGAVTREVEKIVGTCVIRQYTDDFIDGTVRPVIRLPHGPLPNATAVTLIKSIYPGGPQWTASQLHVNPAAGTVRQLSQLEFYYGPWLGTYMAGRLEIPENVINGSKEALWDLWTTQRGLSADVAESAAVDELQVPPYYRLPPRALSMLEPERMPGFA